MKLTMLVMGLGLLASTVLAQNPAAPAHSAAVPPAAPTRAPAPVPTHANVPATSATSPSAPATAAKPAKPAVPPRRADAEKLADIVIAALDSQESYNRSTESLAKELGMKNVDSLRAALGAKSKSVTDFEYVRPQLRALVLQAFTDTELEGIAKAYQNPGMSKIEEFRRRLMQLGLENYKYRRQQAGIALHH